MNNSTWFIQRNPHATEEQVQAFCTRVMLLAEHGHSLICARGLALEALNHGYLG